MHCIYLISGKWLELLKQVAPQVSRAVVIRDPSSPGGGGQLGALQAVAPSFGVEVTPVGLSDAGEIERAIVAARDTNAGLIVTVSPLATVHRELIITLAAKHKIPAVYPLRYFATSGGLISYGPERIEPYRRAPSYVDPCWTTSTFQSGRSPAAAVNAVIGMARTSRARFVAHATSSSSVMPSKAPAGPTSRRSTPVQAPTRMSALGH
jgi:hypothetical protein